METTKITEYPQIRYHITYDESLTLKDLEDLISLIRVSTNAVLEKMGIPRAQANALQKIEKIEPGSIEMIMETLREVLAILGDIAGVVGLAGKIVNFIILFKGFNFRNYIFSKRISARNANDLGLY